MIQNDFTKYLRVQTIVGKPPSFTEALQVYSNPVVTARGPPTICLEHLWPQPSPWD
ncbi:hypothetical protein GYMLUDRAFT_76956 [Collybiopsis luxurians FD-317 M1]|uniref:Uncharacterized protein n=1 Tax=Collybiopsis luxurians FD-317 M1 TaxID=944289 RepID=A0A0D0BIK9_9AGAR|nr:hypothetical protein GYMLUDRAFT_76956 [Collybiopsis luxurians FD-317 M1]